MELWDRSPSQSVAIWFDDDKEKVCFVVWIPHISKIYLYADNLIFSVVVSIQKQMTFFLDKQNIKI